MGSKEKFWFGEVGQVRQLFKYSRPAHGEDWSEKVAYEIARALEVPAAKVDLATHRGRNGIVTPDFCDGASLWHGNELMSKVFPEYPLPSPRMLTPEHTVHSVLAVLIQDWIVRPAVLADGRTFLAADTFVGYLMLDALIVNSDRHHENWGILIHDRSSPVGPSIRLAPTYDHASSLGRELLDRERLARLDGRDTNRTVERYLSRAAGRFFADESDIRPISPFRAFELSRYMRWDAATYWLERLASTPHDVFERIIERVPEERMSQPARRFALELLRLTRLRLLELLRK